MEGWSEYAVMDDKKLQKIVYVFCEKLRTCVFIRSRRLDLFQELHLWTS